MGFLKLSLLVLLGLLVVIQFEQVRADSSSQSESEEDSDEDGCLDLANNCAQMKRTGLCNNSVYKSTINTYCRKTCNVCDEDANDSGEDNSNNGKNGGRNNGGSNNCKDASRSCYNWNRNGYCGSSFYTRAQKLASCGQTCGLC